MVDSSKPSFEGKQVVLFESRRSGEMSDLIRKFGGIPVSAPAMREIPLQENPAALRFAKLLQEQKLDIAVFLTGVGTRLLAEVVEPQLPREKLAESLTRIITVARGPKSSAALRELGVNPSVIVPEPNTWREVLLAIEQKCRLKAMRIAVQEYGESNKEFLGSLTERGAEVFQVPVYRWSLPEDTQPLKNSIQGILQGKYRIVLFTSATQVRHFFQVAGEANTEQLRRVLTNHAVVGSIGPVCSESLNEQGVQPDVEPEQSKMLHLIKKMAQECEALLGKKEKKQSL